MAGSNRCIVCERDGASRRDVGDLVVYECQRCGSFVLSDTVVANDRALSRRSNPAFPHEPLAAQDAATEPAAGDQSLLLWIGDNQASPESSASERTAAVAAWLGCSLPKSGSEVEAGFYWLLEETMPSPKQR
jgi:hypothetical protein